MFTYFGGDKDHLNGLEFLNDVISFVKYQPGVMLSLGLLLGRSWFVVYVVWCNA